MKFKSQPASGWFISITTISSFTSIKALAANDGILPTRLRYPSDEEFRNKTHYFEAVNGWLGGTNNMTTNVWWADHTDKRK